MSMKADSFSLSWISDPQVFAVNRLDAVSDHDVYASAQEAEQGVSSLKRSLAAPGACATPNAPTQAPAEYWREGFDDHDFDWVQVPGHLQMQGYGTIQYVNTQYPWDGNEDLKPGEVSVKHNATASYVKRFSLTEAEAASRVVLTLEGVESSAAVWLNGQFIGYGEDGFTPSRYDVSQAAAPRGKPPVRPVLPAYLRQLAGGPGLLALLGHFPGCDPDL